MIPNWTEENIPDLSGKTAIVTGANRGIGFATASALSRNGASVILACRNVEKGTAAVQQIMQEYPEAKVAAIQLDLSDQGSVHQFAAQFTSRYEHLDILINNAGIMRTPFRKSPDGFELQFATNHLGHFALTGLLLEQLISTPRARVVTVSSWGHTYGVMDFENLNAEKHYDAGMAYAESKLANILFTNELQRKFEDAGLDTLAAAVHPGWTATDLPLSWSDSGSPIELQMIRLLHPLIGQPPQMGALPSLYAATAPDVQGGGYYGPGHWAGMRGSPAKMRSSQRSYDTALAARLWHTSEELTGVQYNFPTTVSATHKESV